MQTKNVHLLGLQHTIWWTFFTFIVKLLGMTEFSKLQSYNVQKKSSDLWLLKRSLKVVNIALLVDYVMSTCRRKYQTLHLTELISPLPCIALYQFLLKLYQWFYRGEEDFQVLSMYFIFCPKKGGVPSEFVCINSKSIYPGMRYHTPSLLKSDFIVLLENKYFQSISLILIHPPPKRILVLCLIKIEFPLSHDIMCHV